MRTDIFKEYVDFSINIYYCLVFILYTNKQPFPLDFGKTFKLNFEEKLNK